MHSCHLLFDHFQLTLIHGPKIPGSYAILFLTASDFTFTTRHIHNWTLFPLGLASSFLLELFLHSSQVAFWSPTDLGSSSFNIITFLSFHTVHGVLKSIMLKWFAIPFSSGPHLFIPGNTCLILSTILQNFPKQNTCISQYMQKNFIIQHIFITKWRENHTT